VADAGFFASKLKTLEDPKVGKTFGDNRSCLQAGTREHGELFWIEQNSRSSSN